MKQKMHSATHAPSTVKKALFILTILKDEKNGLRLVDLTKKIEMNRTTTYRLVSALLESGFVSYNPMTKKYQLGLRILEFAHSILSGIELREVARPFLQALVQTCRETVHLGILDGGEIVYIDKFDGLEPVTLLTHVGKTIPAYITAMGKAIMAYLPAKELENVLDQQSFEPRTKNTITDKQTFIDHLKLVKSRGYATDKEEGRISASCVGAPVFDFSGKVVAAISISSPTFRLTQKQMNGLGEQAKSMALKISNKLGYLDDHRA